MLEGRAMGEGRVCLGVWYLADVTERLGRKPPARSPHTSADLQPSTQSFPVAGGTEEDHGAGSDGGAMGL